MAIASLICSIIGIIGFIGFGSRLVFLEQISSNIGNGSIKAIFQNLMQVPILTIFTFLFFALLVLAAFFGKTERDKKNQFYTMATAGFIISSIGISIFTIILSSMLIFLLLLFFVAKFLPGNIVWIFPIIFILSTTGSIIFHVIFFKRLAKGRKLENITE